MSIECKYADIQANINDVCNYVSNNCEYAYFNLYALHYCYLNSNLWLSIPIVSIIALLCFYLLSDTSNRYLSIALTKISDKLKISQNLAGLTFLALGNGAPDVISSIVASGDDQDGIDFSLGALMGAGTFVTSFVLASVVFFAKQVKVNKIMFTRDIILYLATIGILCLFSLDGIVYLWESILFFSIYLVYVIIAVIQDKCCNRETNELDAECEEKIAKSIVNEISVVHFKFEEEESKEFENTQVFSSPNTTNIFVDNSDHINPNSRNTCIRDVLKNEHFYEEDAISSSEQNNSPLQEKQKNIIGKLFKNHYSTLLYRIKKHYIYHSDTNWDEKNLFWKIFYIIIGFPTTIARDLTIPPCTIDKWNRYFFIIMPICSLLFITLITSTYTIFLNNLILLFSTIGFLLILCFILYRFTYRNRLPSFLIIMCLFNFTMSIFWIWFISEMLVDVLKLYGVMFNVPESFLGMTLLSFGNSAPDLSVNCALARAGYGEMGIAGSIAGPLFNVLIGLGISLIKKNLTQGPIKFTFFDLDKKIILFICVVTLSFNLLRLLIQSLFLKFKLTNSVAIVGYLIYLIFFVAICFFTFKFES